MTKRKYVPPGEKHLTWLVRCRSQNQITSLALHKIMTDNEAFLRSKKNVSLLNWGVSMVAVSFSLWRAVFLSDRTGEQEHRFEGAWSFLGSLIADNAINYSQDKNAREWVFLYYLNNARYRLAAMASRQPALLEAFKEPEGPGDVGVWEYLQERLDVAVNNYGKMLEKQAKASK